MSESRDQAEIADFGRMLGDRQLEGAVLQVPDNLLRRIEGGDLDRAGLAGLLDAVGGAGG